MNGNMIAAPCGMNCSLCIAYQREKRKCSGCNKPDENKPKHCSVCRIKHCEEMLQTETGFCYSCRKFPCKRLKQLDTRYRTKYGMSMIENLHTIETEGIERFILLEIKKWTCKECGSLICVHREKCQTCGNKKDA
jgi:hypothetical protein